MKFASGLTSRVSVGQKKKLLISYNCARKIGSVGIELFVFVSLIYLEAKKKKKKGKIAYGDINIFCPFYHTRLRPFFEIFLT